jgi:LysR family transcriptional activator of nhaA
MKNQLNYHQLYYFKIVSDEKSVSKAASRLLIELSALSSQLKDFEENLGIKLFDRTNDELILTEHGKLAYKYAAQIFKLGSELKEVISGIKEPDQPILKIGALDSIPRQILSKIVRFSRQDTLCKIMVFDGDPETLLLKLKNHEIDLLLTTFLPTGEGCENILPRLLSKTQVSFFGAAQEWHLKENFPESIKKYPLVMPTYDSKLRFDIDKWFKEKGWKPNIIVESQDISVKKNIAMDDIGILPTAEHTVQKQVQAGELVCIGALEGVFEELFLLSADKLIPNQIARRVFKSFEV